MSGLLQDLRFGLRALARNYRMTIVSVISLALGIGAVTSIYCTVSTVLLNPVPFPGASRIVLLFDTVQGHGDDFSSSSYMDYLDYRDKLKDQFESLGAFTGGDMAFRGPDGPERIKNGVVSTGFFSMLRVPMLLGRGISPEADELKGPLEAVISETLWRRAYHSDPAIVGQSITLDGNAFTICGVAPESFRFLFTGPAEAWVSFSVFKQHAMERGNHWLTVWARLRDGVTQEQANQAFGALVAQNAQQYPETNRGREGHLETPGNMLRELTPALTMLVGAVVLVLAIACVNVANLLLANAAGRRKEIAIRAALGATRGRIVRQLLTEAVILALLGGALGVLVAMWGTALITMLIAAEDRDFYVKFFNFGVRPGVLVFTAGVSLVTGLLFGLAPALEATRTELAETLKEGGRGGGGGLRRHRTLATLVVSEVALALVLLVAAGLLMQSMRNLYGGNPGFDPHNMITFQTNAPKDLEKEPRQLVNYYERMAERIAQVGGVKAVGATTLCPFSGDHSATWVFIEGKPEPTPDKQPLAGYNMVTTGYFEALGVPIVAGRGFTAEDRLPDTYWEQVKRLMNDEIKPKDLAILERVVVINETMAKEFWPGEDALGRRFAQGKLAEGQNWYRVIGIVKDFHSDLIMNPVQPEMYLPVAQAGAGELYFVLRGDAPLAPRMPDIRKAVAEIDPNQALAYVKTMEYRIGERTWFSAFIGGILLAFAVIALILSAVGVYGVINCSVSQRTHEIGVRMALGANPWHVQKMIVAQGMKLALGGGLIGVAVALMAARLLQDMLYGIGAADPLTFAGVTAILLVVAAAASWIPARKATKVNPVIALRYE